MSESGKVPGSWDGPDEEMVHKLRLFVAGTSSISARAITNLKEILETHLSGQYDLEIVDIHQQPNLAQDENITAVPMLVKQAPIPKRLLVGDMSNKQKVLRGLGLSDEEQ